jgi:hypothetical protein
MRLLLMIDCGEHIGEFGYCSKIGHSVPKTFCSFACKGNWQGFFDEDMETKREKFRQSVEDDGEIVSVIIPVCQHDMQYLRKTIESVRDNAIGKLEIIAVYDGTGRIVDAAGVDNAMYYDERVGIRHALNEAVKRSSGKYVFKLDSHCAMSPGWDTRMKASCKPNTIVNTTFDVLDEYSWEGLGQDMGPVYFGRDLKARFGHPWPVIPRPVELEMMGMLGCAFMIEKDYYKKLGGCDTRLGMWGGLGSEWALKCWLTGGRVLLRTDVVCYHLFRDKAPFTIKSNGAYKALHKKWSVGKAENQSITLGQLVSKFSQYTLDRPPISTRFTRTLRSARQVTPLGTVSE